MDIYSAKELVEGSRVLKLLDEVLNVGLVVCEFAGAKPVSYNYKIPTSIVGTMIDLASLFQ
jgi:hypothetical protein